MDLIGFDYVLDEEPLTKAELRRIAEGLLEELEELEGEREELIYSLETVDEKIREVKNDMVDYGLKPPKTN